MNNIEMLYKTYGMSGNDIFNEIKECFDFGH